MASHFYSKRLIVAEDRVDENIVVGTSSVAAAEIEVRVLDGTTMTRLQAYNALEHIRDFLVSGPSITNLKP